MKTITVIAPAKLNLALDILGLNEKNYHLMNMIMQTVTLYDTIKISQSAKRGIEISSNIRYIPNDERNIAHKVSIAFFKATNITDFGISIDMKKKIPSQAGMAGGSADAAGVLVALNEIYDTKLNIKDLCDIGEKIGADIPYCLVGGTAHVTGIGENVKKIVDMPPCSIVIAKPSKGINTKMAFDKIDSMGINGAFDANEFIAALGEKDLYKICSKFYNAFEQVCNIKDVFNIKNVMMQNHAINAIMTGSGSAVFGVYDDIALAKNCYRELKQNYQFAALCHPCKESVIITEKNF